MPSARDGRNLLTRKKIITVYYLEWRGKDIAVASKNICKSMTFTITVSLVIESETSRKVMNVIEGEKQFYCLSL